ncbi:WXG100 family type VII secretion target [Amycolatopsis sp. FDAARGOS 1241]|uniref:WXG100 family type VII secretion target n=1 Tax=Amycolatopsis sp. FDAARGOS 1241 TaxID=2778070 RepID=UPI00194DE5F7|nr:WXG100 family type VII secretion target [Amycolatopsis sp. FDAARGOS 1241]QRP45361.1 WXG100 family type VII secretion target [Amycolatopsis sp. FDAARGOS 1241]
MTEPSLTFVSELAGELGVTDPVAAYYRPLVGRWADLDEEAQRLRTAAKTAGGVSAELAEELGRLDASWSGADADAFVTYLGEIRSASEGVEDALDELAGALDELAGTLRKIVGDATHVLTDAADLLSESAMLPVGGVSRSRAQLRETEQSMRSFYDAAEDVLQEFGRLCDGVDAPAGEQSSIVVRRHYPAEQFRLHGSDSARPAEAGEAAQAGSTAPDSGAQHGNAPDQVENTAPDAATSDTAPFDTATSDTTAPSSADDSVSPSAAEDVHQGKESGVDPHLQQVDAGVLPVQPEPAPAPAQPAQGQPGMAMPMMPMMGGFGGGAGGGGGGTRQPKNRTSAKPSELLGEPEHVTPPVIGEDPRPQKPDKAKKPQK